MSSAVQEGGRLTFGDWKLFGRALLSFWALHLTSRVGLAFLNGRPRELLDPALWAAMTFGFGLTVLFCLILRAWVPRGLTFGLGLAAVLSVPACLIFASVELALFFQLSPEVTRPTSSQTLADGTVVTRSASGHVTYRQKSGRVTRLALPPLRQRMLDRVPQTLASNATGWYFFYFGLGALFVGLAHAERLRIAERQAAEFKRLAQEAQLRALRYQVNPHFLFNTLNALSALIMTGRLDEAETMILNISNFFRTTLTLDPAADITLGEELVLQQLYLDIEQGRFPDRLRVRVDIDAALLDLKVPALILQPLVENAIKYGVAPSHTPVEVRLAARLEGDILILVVENDAPGVGTVSPGTDGTGVGLINVAQRVQARFGAAAACSPEVVGGAGFRVTFRIPALW